MKSHVTSSAHPVRSSFLQKIIALGAATLLAVSTLAASPAWANEAAAPTSLNGKIAPRALDTGMSSLSKEISRTAALVRAVADASDIKKDPRLNDSVDADSPTMTFYYYEMVHYEDPDWSDPDNLRLLYTRVEDKVSVGDVLDTWDYVDKINGYFFFDAWPARPVVTADNSRNKVELFYMNPELNEYTVNYYRVRANTASDIEDESAAYASSVIEEVDGVSMRFDHLGAETVDGQYFNKKIVGADIAPELEALMYLDSYPQSIRVQTEPEENIINLLYTDDHQTLPDLIEVPDSDLVATPDAVPGEDDSQPDGESGADASESEVTPGEGSSTPDSAPHPVPGTGTATDTPANSGTTSPTPVENGSAASNDSQQPAESGGASDAEADSQPSAEGDENDDFTTKVTESIPERELAQTGDGTLALASLLLAFFGGGTAAFAASRRRA